jgi:hypothetical protein
VSAIQPVSNLAKAEFADFANFAVVVELFSFAKIANILLYAAVLAARLTARLAASLGEEQNKLFEKVCFLMTMA